MACRMLAVLGRVSVGGGKTAGMVMLRVWMGWIAVLGRGKEEEEAERGTGEEEVVL